MTPLSPHPQPQQPTLIIDKTRWACSLSLGKYETFYLVWFVLEGVDGVVWKGRWRDARLRRITSWRVRGGQKAAGWARQLSDNLGLW